MSLSQKGKNKLGLMLTTLINNVLYMFLNTFLIAYFFTLTNYNYKIISIYYIFTMLALSFTFCILSRIIKNRSKVCILKIGIFLHTLFILAIALLKDQIVHHYILLGTFYGIVQAFFWSAAHTLINTYAGEEAKGFVSLKSILSKSLKIIFPFLFGASIELSSFSTVAKVIVILGVLQFLCACLIKEEKRNKQQKYNLFLYIRYLFRNKAKDMHDCYKIIALDGIINYLLETVVTILIVMTFKTNFSLGTLTTIFSIFSIVSLFVFQRIVKDNTKVLQIGTLFIILGMFLLLIDINKTTVILYNLINSIFLVLLLNNAEAKRYGTTNRYPKIKNEFLIEHQVVSELFLNISRIIGYSILYLVSLTNNITYFKVLLVLISVCIYFYSVLLVKLNKR